MIRKLVVAAAALAGVTVFTGVPAPVQAASPYPFANVEANVYARTGAGLNYSTHGVVLDDGSGPGTTQRSWVRCYRDGGWATGNYRSNRWFKVYVYDSYHGLSNPHWLYVHSSYVYNQPRVGQC